MITGGVLEVVLLMVGIPLLALKDLPIRVSIRTMSSFIARSTAGSVPTRLRMRRDECLIGEMLSGAMPISLVVSVCGVGKATAIA